MNMIKRIAISAGFLAVAATPALADEASEKFTFENANAVLETLKNPELSARDRSAQFVEAMDRFSDVKFVSRYVLGDFWRELSKEEFEEYFAAFRKFAMATYEAQLDRMLGESVEVISSQDDTTSSRKWDYSEVKTYVVSASGDKQIVEWKMRKRKDEDASKYKVIDVAITIDGTLTYLGAFQRSQFKGVLDQNFYNVDALIEYVKSETERRFAAKGQSTIGADQG